MGSKNITMLLNMIGSGYKFGRCIPPTHSRKLKRCVNANYYHISAQKLKEIQKQMSEGDKKESQKRLFPSSLNDTSLEGEKSVSKGVERPDDLKISEVGDFIADSSNQKDVGKNEMPLKLEKASESSAQVDLNTGKLKADQKYEEKQTNKVNELEKEASVNMMDSIKKEIKGSYSSLRQKKLDKNPSDYILFGSRNLHGDKEKLNSTKEINSKPFNKFDSTFNIKVESNKSSENYVEPKENNTKELKLDEKGSINDEKINVRTVNETKDINSQEGKLAYKKQIDIAERSISEKKVIAMKGMAMLGKESTSGENLNTLEKKHLRTSPSIQENPKTADDVEAKNVASASNSTNSIDKINMDMIKKSKNTGSDSSVKEDKPRTLEVDRPTTKKYMLNTLLDPIAKSSQKKVQMKESSPQGGRGESKEAASSKNPITNEKMTDGKQIVDRSNKPKMSGDSKAASNDLLVKVNAVRTSNENTAQSPDIAPNQQVDQKSQDKSNIENKLNISKAEKHKMAESSDLLKENIVDIPISISIDTSTKEGLNRQVDKTIGHKSKIDNKLKAFRLEKHESPIDLLNESIKDSNKTIFQASNKKDDHKITAKSNVSNKLDNSKMRQVKSASKAKLVKGKAKPKPKPTLKVKYRLKETLKDKMEKLNKQEKMKILTSDSKSRTANEKVDLQSKPEKKEIQLHTESNRLTALTKQDEFPKVGSQIAAVQQNPQRIDKQLQQSNNTAIKKDLNERGIMPFDSSYIMKQLAKSRQSESIEDIPGPKIMRACSNIVNALPVIGDKKIVSNRMKPLESLFNTHGDIVCLNIPLCGNVILVDKPELIHEVYRQRDMSQIMNSTFDSLNEVYNVLGKKRMRMDAMSSVDDQMTCVIEHFDLKNLFWSASRYHNSLEKISDQLVERITFTRDMHNEVPKDFIKELNKWSLECMMQVLFATEIGSLKSTSYLGHQETDIILKSLTDATDALRNCESGIQLWRVYETSSFTKLTQSIKHLERFLCKHIPLLRHEAKLEQRLEMLQSNLESKQNASSLISGLILSGYVDVDKLLKICMETMLIAVNTTSTSLGFVLYHMARNQEKQKILHKELMSVLPDKSSKLNPEVLQELPYLNAVVQETLRLKHPIPYSVMRLQRSIVLHKYYIPAGTWVMTANEVACLREENFEDAQLFKPERWLESSPELYQDTISPLLEAQFEPFLGRDWLQKQLLIGTAKVIRNFNVNYRYGEIGKEGEFLSKPTKPFQFEFLEQHL
ncbi:uncharacterized protein LOC111062391 isoform X2 [Nilaparvata lugens]|uniref:uncharacterized protein LOC111062391 isoform X2 n=1 Tax=Nilaparvata lugens TaxID=108931 RepID=UPI00193E2652|nr:uncharacterized protein LOC111062391 isoform X2 [Nilaparvata lugens]